MKAYYDLHIHSCLSPCGDDDMTPNNIAGMAKICELDIIAVTDHNSCKNCKAVMNAAEQYGVCVVPGMELCTAEEIHAVCLFPDIENAMRFDSYVYEHIMDIKNRPDIYGNQLILNENDEQTGFEKKLLITAATISISGLYDLVANEYGGICFPAHIDKDSYSILASLGEIPQEEHFTAAEISKNGDYNALSKSNPILNNMTILHNSDAHYLEYINQRENCIELEEISAKALINALRKKVIK